LVRDLLEIKKAEFLPPSVFSCKNQGVWLALAFLNPSRSSKDKMLPKTPAPIQRMKSFTSSILQTLMILADGANLRKANLFFEDCGQQLKGKVYAKSSHR
jgi:hypothetical protein